MPHICFCISFFIPYNTISRSFLSYYRGLCTNPCFPIKIQVNCVLFFFQQCFLLFQSHIKNKGFVIWLVRREKGHSDSCVNYRLRSADHVQSDPKSPLAWCTWSWGRASAGLTIISSRVGFPGAGVNFGIFIGPNVRHGYSCSLQEAKSIEISISCFSVDV